MDNCKDKYKRICALKYDIFMFEYKNNCNESSHIGPVIVSRGDVSDFQHLQAVVGDFNAVRILMSVFFSPCKNPRLNNLLFFDKHQGRVVI